MLAVFENTVLCSKSSISERFYEIHVKHKIPISLLRRKYGGISIYCSLGSYTVQTVGV
jgi:hypothetical protein